MFSFSDNDFLLFVNSSNAPDTNVMLTEQDYILFTVRACSDASVRLTPLPGDYSQEYQVNIGVDGNTLIEIRRVGNDSL